MGFFVPGYGVVGASKEQDKSTRSQTTKGELYPVGNRSDGVVFQFNPEHIERTRTPLYAEVGAAAADYWKDYDGPSPLQWIRNPPEVISFELMFSETGKNDVEESINKITKMMSSASRNPRGQTPGPPNLIFSYGNRGGRVRIMSARFKEERHTPDLKVQQVRIQLDLKTVKIGRR